MITLTLPSPGKIMCGSMCETPRVDTEQMLIHVSSGYLQLQVMKSTLLFMIRTWESNEMDQSISYQISTNFFHATSFGYIHSCKYIIRSQYKMHLLPWITVYNFGSSLLFNVFLTNITHIKRLIKSIFILLESFTRWSYCFPLLFHMLL